MENYKIKGFNDEFCNCDVCGRSELKGTFIIENLNTGDIFRAGSNCGSKITGMNKVNLKANLLKVNKENQYLASVELENSLESIEYYTFKKNYSNNMSNDNYIKLSILSNNLDLKINELNKKYNLKRF